MAYLNVDTKFRAARADGDLTGRITIALIKKAVTRLPAIVGSDDQREFRIAAEVVGGAFPTSWILVIMGYLDIAGQLDTATDPQIDTQVNTAWTALTKAK